MSLNGQSFNHIVYYDGMLASLPNALQKLLDICESYAKEHDILYSVKKSKCMIVKPKVFKDIYVPLVFDQIGFQSHLSTIY